MARKRKPDEEPGIPAWMLSYSDMMTNLLCFFILMVTLSTQRDSGFVTSGIGSYMERLEALGLPGLMPSTRTLIPKDSPLAQYKPPRVDPLAKEHWVEHTQKQLREEFDRLSHGEGILEAEGRPFPVPLGIGFSPRSARLTLKDRRDLDLIAPLLRERGGQIEVVGSCIAEEAGTSAGRLELSLQRALAVVRYLDQANVQRERLIPVGAGSHPAGSTGDSAQRKVVLRWLLE